VIVTMPKGLVEFFEGAIPGTDRTVRVVSSEDGSTIVWLSVTTGAGKLEVSSTGESPCLALKKAFEELAKFFLGGSP